MKVKRSDIKSLIKEVLNDMIAEKKKNLVKSLEQQPGVTDAKALAASIGRKKYGKEKFQKAAAAGKKLSK